MYGVCMLQKTVEEQQRLSFALREEYDKQVGNGSSVGKCKRLGEKSAITDLHPTALLSAGKNCKCGVNTLLHSSAAGHTCVYNRSLEKTVHRSPGMGIL